MDVQALKAEIRQRFATFLTAEQKEKLPKQWKIKT